MYDAIRRDATSALHQLGVTGSIQPIRADGDCFPSSCIACLDSVQFPPGRASADRMRTMLANHLAARLTHLSTFSELERSIASGVLPVHEFYGPVHQS